MEITPILESSQEAACPTKGTLPSWARVYPPKSKIPEFNLSSPCGHCLRTGRESGHRRDWNQGPIQSSKGFMSTLFVPGSGDAKMEHDPVPALSFLATAVALSREPYIHYLICSS